MHLEFLKVEDMTKHKSYWD